MKLGILLFSISFVLYNCVKEDATLLQEKNKYTTVNHNEAIAFLKGNLNKLSKTNNNIQLSFDVNSINHQPLTNTNQKITVIPAKTKFKNIYSRILVLKVNGKLKNVLFNMIPDTLIKSKKFTGIISVTNLNGKFINGYRVKNGLFTSHFFRIKQLHKASLFSFLFQENYNDCDETLVPNSEFCPLIGEEADLGTVTSNRIDLSQMFIEFDYEDSESGGDSSGGENETWDYNDNNQQQNNCPPGYVKNSKNVCVKKPCIGDPVKDPKIVSSGISGKKGGTFGCTRTQADRTCGGVKGKKKHDGLDIKAAVNTSTFSMYDGTVSSVRNTFSAGQYKKDSYGNYIIVTTKINGTTIFIKYNHLNKVNIKKGDKVKAGDIIGLNGNTGNANPPTRKGMKKVTPHIHLQIFDANWKSINPENYLKTKFDNNKNTINNTNC